MSEVYIITEDVRYESTNIKGVYENRTAAIKAARELASSFRYDGEWQEWSNDEPHIISLQNRDVTFVVQAHEVQE